MNTQLIIEKLSKSRFPSVSFEFSTEVKKMLEERLVRVFSEIGQIEISGNHITMAHRITKTDSYLPDFRIIQEIILALATQDIDVKHYEVINIHDTLNRNWLTMIINFIEP